ncbi:DUF58 domain-containing protein [Saccharospirillum salsuginis]|uniref:DUF58 domain-containing protein n=1 Tax=Saccharospirillum salsuginis TaxID=418750 RepID=A0A918KSS1_9GAMM|nr:DUF58 domain-containing protein [Saccharospirillum salsuginis]GGX74369.1 hypothetical protein GCM10007392_47180 [Saccharospirillum salsuginis]
MGLRRTFHRRVEAWIARRLPVSDSVTLNQSRIFILPSRQGMVLLLVAFVVLLLAINFESSLNYALGFWLVAMIWAAVHFTYRNLSGLTLKADRASLVQAGEAAEYHLKLDSDVDRYRGPLELIHDDWGLVTAVMDGEETDVSLSRETDRRGRHPLPRFRLESRYPFGLVVAWSHVELDLSAWAYPEPIDQDAHHQAGSDAGDATDDHFIHSGSEDFHALREYQAGDAMHRIHWPSFARDQLMVKAFVDYQAADEWLDWANYPSLMGEQRLAALSWQINQCLADDRPFGLRLPDREIPPGKGPAHTEQCRRALAEFGER